MKIDYLIVGSGLAGIAFAQICRLHHKSFLLLSDDSQNSTRIAAGLYNPVVLKRFSAVWQAQEQIDYAQLFYRQLEKDLTIQVDFPKPLYRIFHSVEEQNNWFIAADKPNLTPFLSTQLIQSSLPYIKAPLGFGAVNYCGFVDTAVLVTTFRKYLEKTNQFRQERFDYQTVEVHDDLVSYRDVKAKHLVFAEGFGVHQNPFFNYLPLDGTKGELVIIKAPQLQLNKILKSGVYVVPIGNDRYKIGATYNWEDKSDDITAAARKEILSDLDTILNCEYEVVEQLAGVRPTVKDRRPLIGTHPIIPQFHVLNGLGTRGVMLGPVMAKALFEHIEKGTPLDPYIDIKRIKNGPSNPDRS